MKKMKDKQVANYNKTAGKVEKEFITGEKVMIQNKFKKIWLPGVIIYKTNYPRSYTVEDNNGRLLRRNSIFLKRVKSYDCLSEFEEVGKCDKTVNKEDIEDENNVDLRTREENEKNYITRYGRKIIKVKRYGTD